MSREKLPLALGGYAYEPLHINPLVITNRQPVLRASRAVMN